MALLELTEGDTRPSRVRLTANRRAIPLPGATVTLTMKPARGLAGSTLRRACVVVDADTGTLDIPWQSGDLQEGLSLAKFEVIANDGKVFHVPGGEDWLDVEVGDAGSPGPESPATDTVQALVDAEAAARVAADAALEARVAALEALLP
jgi:hypothetical protein